ncbi:MAG: rod shape-determining protein MreC [Candidatus Marivariicella sp.]
MNAKHKKSNAFGSLNWNGVNPERLQLFDIASINILNVGDTIITGGMSTYFPEDILIGRIIDYAITKENGYYDIEIELSNNIGNLNKVYIIDNKHKDEIKGFE